MRIGHQIYNYLNDYTDNGSHTLLNSIEVENKGEKHYIHEACIVWSEDQVYLTVVTGEIPSYMTINQFLKWMGGSTNPQSYKPLYQLRDQLRIMAKKKYQSMKHMKSTTTVYYHQSSTFK